MVGVYRPTLRPWLAWTSYGVDGSSCGLLLGPRVQQNLWRAPLIGYLTPPLLWCLLELAHMSQIGLGASRVYDKYSEKQQGPVALGYMINTLAKGRVPYELRVNLKKKSPVPCHCLFFVFYLFANSSHSVLC